MKLFLSFFAVVIFSIFIGSQITEGALLVPYWQSLSAEEFYAYYNQFGPSIAQFYTVLTILSALLPIGLSAYCKFTKSGALKLALLSALFALLFVSSFYLYFKGTNELFYQGAFSEQALSRELLTWSYWHWGRIVIEFISLGFLILALMRMQKEQTN